VTFYGDCVKMCEEFAPNLAVKSIASRQCTVWLSHFHQGIFDQKQHDCRPSPTLRSSVSPIGNKTERPPLLIQLKWSRQNRKRCWTPSQNTSSRMQLNDGRSLRKITTSRELLASRPKVSFWQVGSTSPWNYGWLFVWQDYEEILCY
jgi:hypothetical protein